MDIGYIGVYRCYISKQPGIRLWRFLCVKNQENEGEIGNLWSKAGGEVEKAKNDGKRKK